MKFWILIWSLSWTTFSFSQEPYSYNFSEDVDFQSQTVYDIFEDSEFNMWFGTNEGLFRWDGLDLSSFKLEGFASAYSNVQESKHGIIWCQNFSGQIFIVYQNELVLYEDLGNIVSGSIDFKVDYFPEIYYFTEYGLMESNFYTKKKQLYHYEDEKEPPSIIFKEDTVYFDHIHSPYKSEKGFNCTSRSMPIKFDIESKIFLDLVESRTKWPNREIMLFNISSKKIIGIGNSPTDQLFTRKIGDEKWQKTNLSENIKINLSAICVDEAHDFALIGHSQGVIKLNLITYSVETIFSGFNASKIIQDREQNYWISTLNQGVIVVPNLKTRSFKLADEKHSFVNAEKKLLAVSNRGKIYAYQKNNFEPLADLNAQYDIGKTHYNAKMQILTFENSDLKYEISTQKISKNTLEKGQKAQLFFDNQTSLDAMSSMLSITGSSQESVQRFNPFSPPKSQIKKIINRERYRQILREKRCYSFCYLEKTKEIFAAFSDGIFHFKNDKISEILYNSKSILSTEILSFNDQIYLTTTNNEVLQLVGGTPQPILKTDKRITACSVNDKSIIVSTINGLVRYDRLTKNQTTINQSDGLPSGYIDAVTHFQNSIFLNTSEGISILPNQMDVVNTNPPIVEMVSVQVNEVETSNSELLKLSHYQNSLVFEFKAINQKARGNYDFLYKLEGIDSAWQTQDGTVNFSRYPSIPPGEYEFRLKAKNEDGFESEEIITFLKIAPPFYQETWFNILIILLIIIIISTFFLIRIQILKRRNKLLSDKQIVEKELSKSQLSALKSQMNPHFVFNALNSIQDYIMSNDKEQASDYLGLFADLMRKYLNLSQQDYITLDEEIETLKMYLTLEKVRFEETLEVNVQYDSDLDLSNYKIPPMLIQPFVENAIKHGLLHKSGEQKLNISFELNAGEIIVKVKDNGIGRKRSSELKRNKNSNHVSFATSAIHKRIQLINETKEYHISLEYNDLQEPTGTEVEIRVSSLI